MLEWILLKMLNSAVYLSSNSDNSISPIVLDSPNPWKERKVTYGFLRGRWVWFLSHYKSLWVTPIDFPFHLWESVWSHECQLRVVCVSGEMSDGDNYLLQHQTTHILCMYTYVLIDWHLTSWFSSTLTSCTSPKFLEWRVCKYRHPHYAEASFPETYNFSASLLWCSTWVLIRLLIRWNPKFTLRISWKEM